MLEKVIFPLDIPLPTNYTLGSQMAAFLARYIDEVSNAFSGVSIIIEFSKSSLELPVEVQHFMWSVLDHFEKEVAKQKKKMRVSLLEQAEEKGEEQSNGSFVLELPRGKVTKQRKIRKTLDSGGILELVNSKGLKSSQAGSFQFIPNETLLMDLIASGDIKAEELAEHVNEQETWALQVKKPDTLVGMLSEENYGITS